MKKLLHFKYKNKYESIFLYAYLKKIILVLYLGLFLAFSSYVYTVEIIEFNEPKKIIIYNTNNDYYSNRMKIVSKHYKSITFEYYDVRELTEDSEGIKILEKYNCKEVFYKKNITGMYFFVIYVSGNGYAYEKSHFLAFLKYYKKIIREKFGGVK